MGQQEWVRQVAAVVFIRTAIIDEQLDEHTKLGRREIIHGSGEWNGLFHLIDPIREQIYSERDMRHT